MPQCIFTRIVCALALIAGLGVAGGSPALRAQDGAGGRPAGILGLKAVEGDFAFYDTATDAVRNMPRPPVNDAVFFYLSKEVYPAEDQHLDVVAWLDTRLTGERTEGVLLVEMLDARGAVLFSQQITPPGRQLFFSVPFGSRLPGEGARLRLTWKSGYKVYGTAERRFKTLPPANVAKHGKIAIRVANPEGVTLAAAPMTVGVPFPRGALSDVERLRLVDASGAELPMQARVSARWSRFGPIKWVLLDFEAALSGGPAEFFLEYGEGVARRTLEPMRVETSGKSFPRIAGEALRVDADGLSARTGGDAAFRPLLNPGALLGAFVQHENGKLFTMGGRDATVELEEHGPVKTVVRATGFYTEPMSGATFCRYDTRYYFFRSSPVARVMHTWIFTGDGNKDRIRTMGWRFPYAERPKAEQFLAAEGDASSWTTGTHLLQFEHDRFEVSNRGQSAAREGQRAPGVMRAVADDTQLVFGTKDFWQNYPSELTLDGTAMTFHNWPLNGRPSTDPITPGNSFLLKFAHSGQLLDFRLPDEFLTGAIPDQSSQRKGGERHWSADRESANAQGIAQTEEMWLLAANQNTDVARVMKALNDETLRPVVDPAWVCASGAFYEIHPKDTEKYPEHEAVYEAIALAPAVWNERIGVYGKWIHGDAIFEPRLEAKSAGLYRTFRKAHQGWPYSWTPYVRSGDSRFFKLADNATRQMIDSNFCHYVSPDVKASVEAAKGQYYRRQGWWFRSMVPWTGWRGPVSRSYLADCDYLWNAYYVTGYRRPADIALLWADLTKEEPSLGGKDSRTGPIGRESELRRMSFNLLKSYTEMYQAIFDPWFLAAMHAIADMHLTENRDVPWERDAAGGERVGHFWEPGDREYHRFTGRAEYVPYLANASRYWATYRTSPWSALNPPMIESTAYCYDLTGDETFARRAAYYLDYARTSVWTSDDKPHLKGILANDLQLSRSSVFTGYYLSQFPLALALFERMGREPEPLAEAFYQMGNLKEAEDLGGGRYRYHYPVIRVKKADRTPLRLLMQLNRDAKADLLSWEITDKDGRVVAKDSSPKAAPRWIDLAADLPGGVYTVRTSAELAMSPENMAISALSFPGLQVPLSPPGTPEVMLVPREEGMGIALQKSQYWFHVPKGVSSFTIEFPVDPPNQQARRISVWAPDGRLAWDWQKVVYGVKKPQTVRATIAVSPGQQGKLWRITAPGRITGFRLPPEIPATVAADRDKWFE